MDLSEAISLLQIALRMAIALLLAEAAVGKLSDRAGFEGVVANYQVLPSILVLPVARLLPPVELLIAMGLLTGALAPWPAVAAAGLLMVFAGAMGVNLARGRAAIDCGCGRGGLRQPLSWARVIKNVGLASLLAITASPQTATFGDWAVGLAAGAALFAIDYTLTYLGALSGRDRAPAPGAAR